MTVFGRHGTTSGPPKPKLGCDGTDRHGPMPRGMMWLPTWTPFFCQRNRNGFSINLNLVSSISFGPTLIKYTFSIMHHVNHNTNFGPEQYFQSTIRYTNISKVQYFQRNLSYPPWNDNIQHILTQYITQQGLGSSSIQFTTKVVTRVLVVDSPDGNYMSWQIVMDITK